MKLKNYIKVISDTNECLKIEPGNIKALTRKGQAFIGEKMFSEAFDTFQKVLDIDATNQIAHIELAVLRAKLSPRNAFRMKIEEIDNEESSEKKIQAKSEKLELPEAVHVPKLVQNIIVEEPTPFDKLSPKEAEPREKLILPSDGTSSRKSGRLIQEI